MDHQARRARYEAVQDAVVPPLIWCWASIQQLERLDVARAEAVEWNTSYDNDLPRRTRFWRMDAEKHFAMTAVAKFRRALEAAGDVDDRFAQLLDGFPLTLEWLRNALEHDDERGHWAKDFPESHDKHEWNSAGGGRLGGEIDDGRLKADLEAAFEVLLAIEQTRP